MSHAVPVRGLALALAVAAAAFAAVAPSARAIGFNEGNCSTGSASYALGFFDDMESRPATTWTHNALLGSDQWSYPGTGHASSGDTVLRAADPASASDSVILSPVGTVGGTGQMMLRFTHTYDFESDPGGNYDGGVVEVSINGGAFADAGSGAYNGTLVNYAGDQNPLKGRPAFVASSGGARTTFIQMSVAPGSTVRIRFRIGSDQTLAGGGWWIDDVGLYECAVDTTAPDTTIAGSPTGTNTSQPSLTFTSNENGVGFQCRVDGGDWLRCFSTRSLPAMANGSHRVEVRAVDPAGNADATPDSRTFTVSAPVPDTTIASGPTTAAPSSSATPTFGFTSNVAGSTFTCSLDGGAFAPCPSSYTTPSLSEGSHTLSVAATDAAGNTDSSAATRPFAVDTVAPDTTIAVGPAAGSRIPDPSPSFLLTSHEAGATFECKVDGGSFSPCDASWSAPLLLEGSHTITFRARDAAGNVDPNPVSRTFTVDTTPPDTAITVFPSQNDTFSDSTPQFAFAYIGNDVSTFQCQLDDLSVSFDDGNGFSACSAAYGPGPLADGSFTLRVRAVDPAGNPDPSPYVYTFTIDTTAPDTSISGGPAEGSTTSDATPAFALGSSERNGTFECSLDGAAFGACPASYTPAALSDGPHTLSVHAIDVAGNPDATPATRSFTVDTSAPDTAIAEGPAALTTDPKPTFSLSGGAAFECSIDDGAFAACPASFTTPSLADGVHVVRARSSNAAGTVDPSPASRTFTVDTTPPETTIADGPAAGSSSTATAATFALASEPGATFECSLDGGDFIACPASYATGTLAVGNHLVAFRARDAAGNADPTPATRRFSVAAPTPAPKPQPKPVPFGLHGKLVVGATSVRFAVTIPAAGTVTITAKAGRTTLGSARVPAAGAGTKNVTLKLSKSAITLRRKGVVKATFTFTFKPAAGGKPTTRTTTVKLARLR